MAKYITKPITVEAIQWQKPGDHSKVVEVIKHKAGVAISEHEKERFRGIGQIKYALIRKTGYGPKIIGEVRPGDWIVEINKNEFTVLTNADFKSQFIPKE